MENHVDALGDALADESLRACRVKAPSIEIEIRQAYHFKQTWGGRFERKDGGDFES